MILEEIPSAGRSMSSYIRLCPVVVADLTPARLRTRVPNLCQLAQPVNWTSEEELLVIRNFSSSSSTETRSPTMGPGSVPHSRANMMWQLCGVTACGTLHHITILRRST
jgi:hypothetical protein